MLATHLGEWMSKAVDFCDDSSERFLAITLNIF